MKINFKAVRENWHVTYRRPDFSSETMEDKKECNNIIKVSNAITLLKYLPRKYFSKIIINKTYKSWESSLQTSAL